ncbi:MAG: phosphoribosylformylglycinamidine cyclo-ligase [Actinomycetaceae bacterium]|nr:phosphoribosylformylglycinamidine cyclo-ligase [Actinomycetaceae bacterium]
MSDSNQTRAGGAKSEAPDRAAPSAYVATGSAYAAAGVDTQAGDRAVELMKAAVARTLDARVVGGVGGFAGMVDVSMLRDYRRPLLATSTDGVGTKIAIARAMGVHDTIGQDLVGMVVDDIAVVGARPLLMTDYIACGRVVPERIADIVRGVARACEVVGVPLLGGETAEHPGLMEAEDYDIAGAATGVVEADGVLGAERVREGDVVLAMASSGLHSNGYSLVRRIVADAGWALEREVAEFGRALGEELLEPTRLYSHVCLQMAERAPVHAFSHVTGGGLAANLARVVPAGLQARIDRAAIAVPPVFSVLRELGHLPWADVEDTLNMGVGMVVLAPPEAADAVLAVSGESGIRTWQIGDVVADSARSGAAAVAPSGVGDDGLPQDRIVRGTKGVDAGSVLVHGAYSA